MIFVTFLPTWIVGHPPDHRQPRPKVSSQRGMLVQGVRSSPAFPFRHYRRRKNVRPNGANAHPRRYQFRHLCRSNLSCDKPSDGSGYPTNVLTPSVEENHWIAIEGVISPATLRLDLAKSQRNHEDDYRGQNYRKLSHLAYRASSAAREFARC